MKRIVATGMVSQMGGLIFMAALFGAPGAWGAVEIDSTVEIPPDGLVVVENLAGSIEFSTWDRAEVQVRGDAGKQVEEVEIRPTANGVEIKVRNRKNSRRVDGTDLYLRIPRQASIEADGVSSDISVKGSKGEAITLDTVSGDLEIEAESVRVDVNSVSGDIEFRGSASRVSAQSVSGDVVLIGVEGEISGSTVSGDLSMEAGRISRGRFESVSGDMMLELALQDDGRLTCDSMSGDVHLRLPSDQRADFAAQSYSGTIRSDFGTAVSVSKGPGSSLNHSDGAATARIRIETFSGDITIRAK